MYNFYMPPGINEIKVSFILNNGTSGDESVSVNVKRHHKIHYALSHVGGRLTAKLVSSKNLYDNVNWLFFGSGGHCRIKKSE